MTLRDYGIFVTTGGLQTFLDNFHAELRAWCKAAGHYLNMTRMTKDLLGIDTGADFPVANPGCLMLLLSGGLLSLLLCVQIC